MNDYGHGSSYHPLENDAVGGSASWELGMALTVLMLPVVIIQFLTAFLTPIGVLLAASGLLSAARYGPVYSKPIPILLTGIAIWVAMRVIRSAATRLVGGGTVSRYDLYSRSGQVR